MAAFVLLHHGRQAQAVQRLAGQAQADDAAAVADKLRHDGHGELVGGDDQVGLVLAVEVVHQDDGTAQAQVMQGALQAASNGWEARLGRDCCGLVLDM